MENETNIPYIVFESSLAREERQQKRLTIIIIVLIVLLFLTNLFWVIAWNQYDYVDEGVDIDLDSRDGNANFIGNDGDINNGIDTDKKTENDSGAS